MDVTLIFFRRYLNRIIVQSTLGFKIEIKECNIELWGYLKTILSSVYVAYIS